MVLLDEGIEKIADTLGTDITKGQWGTGTTAPAVDDTGLETPVAASLLTLSSAVSGSTIQFTHTLNTSTGNGNDLTEYELQFSDGTSLNRSVGGAISKTSSVSITTISQITVLRS